MGSLVYPQCKNAKGMGKVHCLINAILDDYYSGRIDKDRARARLIYLIALNRANQWGPDKAVRDLVYEALEEIGWAPRKGRRRAEAEAEGVGRAVPLARAGASVMNWVVLLIAVGLLALGGYIADLVEKAMNMAQLALFGSLGQSAYNPWLPPSTFSTWVPYGQTAFIIVSVALILALVVLIITALRERQD